MKIIITGTTGMVGEGVLLACLANPNVTKILSVSRKPCEISHPKLNEYIVPDFLQLQEKDEKMQGYDAVFFCAGVSSVGMKEDEYRRITFDTTLHFAKVLEPKNKMSFVYVSGGGTDTNGRMAWAKIKGQTEDELMKMPFKKVFCYRVGIMKPFKEQKRILPYYKYFSWLFPILKTFAPGMFNTLDEVGKSMIYAAKFGYEKNIISPKDVKIMAENLSNEKNA